MPRQECRGIVVGAVRMRECTACWRVFESGVGVVRVREYGACLAVELQTNGYAVWLVDVDDIWKIWRGYESEDVVLHFLRQRLDARRERLIHEGSVDD